MFAAATLEWDNCVAFFLTAQPLILLAGLWGLWLTPHKQVMAINLLGWLVCLGCATAVTLVDKQLLPKNLLYNTVSVTPTCSSSLHQAEARISAVVCQGLSVCFGFRDEISFWDHASCVAVELLGVCLHPQLT